MATVTRYVNTGADAGGDGTTNATSSGDNTHAYASLSAWNSAEATDLVTDGDEHIVECAGTTVDTSSVDLTSWTTGASNTLTIRGNRSDAAGYNDTHIYSTSFYRLENGGGANNTYCIRTRTEYVIIDGLQFVFSGTDANDHQCIYINGHANTTNLITIQNNFFLHPSSSTTGARYAIECTDGDSNVEVYNNVFDMSNPSSTLSQAVRFENANAITVENNTIYNGDHGVQIRSGVNSGTHEINNNAVFATAAADIDDSSGAGATVNTDYNATDDSAGRGVNGVDMGDSSASWNAAVVVRATSDFRPTLAGVLAQAGSNSFGISTDKNGDAWWTTRSIGAFSTVSVEDEGVLGATETTDDVSFAGTVAASGAVTGTIGATETADTLVFAVGIFAEGPLAVTEDFIDQLAFSGGVNTDGALAATETSDIFSMSGEVAIVGTLGPTEAPDNVSFSIISDTTGLLAVIEAPDTIGFLGEVPVQGSFALTDLADVLSFNAGSGVLGSVAITEDFSDAAAFAGEVAIAGVLGATENPDSLLVLTPLSAMPVSRAVWTRRRRS